MSAHKFPTSTEFRELLRAMLGPEKQFLWVIVIYSGAISLLSLAIPISVQLLIDTVANTGMLGAVVTLGLVLFALLVVSGLLFALRAWCMELFNRRLFSRLTSEIAMVGLQSPAGWFEPVSHRALFNRFFDIMTVKKNTPYLLSQCFTLLFQSLLGFIVVSLYHSYFLVFSLVLLWLIWLVWKIWG
jgi:ABC-type bacteriocin/lantibiotic exporter with double-glycine peptidase domain